MKKLRIQFVVFFLLLASVVGGLVFFIERQMVREAQALWKSAAEKVYNQFQADISDWLFSEDQRSLEDYQVGNKKLLGTHTNLGVIGYFQIDPYGQFSSPVTAVSQKDLLQKLTAWMSQGEGSAYRPYDIISKKKSQGTQDTGVNMNVYPNPVQEQATKLAEKFSPRKKTEGQDFSVSAENDNVKVYKDKVVANDENEAKEGYLGRASGAAAPVTIAPSAQAPKLSGSLDSSETINNRPEPISIIYKDPFQSRVIQNKYLVFYRRLWKDQLRYTQGFVVEIGAFFDGMMEKPFANSDLSDFSLAILKLGNTSLAQYGLEQKENHTFFSRSLGYPLASLVWQVEASRLPMKNSANTLFILVAGLGCLVILAFYRMYHSIAMEIELSQKREDFVSAVTHELKTPLTSIRMYGEMLEEGWVAEESKRAEYYQHIRKESSRLSRLIENVLQMARLEKKTARLDLKKQNPISDFEMIGEELKKIVESHGFSLTLDIDPDFQRSQAGEQNCLSQMMVYDSESMKQIFLALMENSLKFTGPNHSKVFEMKLIQEGDKIIWSWADRGPGVPEKELKKIFQKFYRVENEMTRTTKGTGIGLAMAKMMIESMNGKIEACHRKGGGLEIKCRFSRA